MDRQVLELLIEKTNKEIIKWERTSDGPDNYDFWCDLDDWHFQCSCEAKYPVENTIFKLNFHNKKTGTSTNWEGGYDDGSEGRSAESFIKTLYDMLHRRLNTPQPKKIKDGSEELKIALKSL
jgi:hypothetical protein